MIDIRHFKQTTYNINQIIKYIGLVKASSLVASTISQIWNRHYYGLVSLSLLAARPAWSLFVAGGIVRQKAG